MARGTLPFKERDVRRFIRAFTKEGVPVRGGRLVRDGNAISIQVFTGRPEDAAPCTDNEWDEVITNDTASAQIR